mmetsp:Transcript_13300/g.9384  ORF Transcript_13300/g.9384 Transcript_13300/m.9384 type:complete len:148 (+) Transcript_13300:466-909(+)
MDVEGSDGSGNLYSSACENADDQRFYFRNRGQVINRGLMYNEHDNQCFDTRVKGTSCNINNTDQLWTYYENGEIVNDSNRLCMDVKKHDGAGDVAIYNCQNEQDQMWTTNCVDDYCFFINKKSTKSCLDARKSGKQVESKDCSYSDT